MAAAERTTSGFEAMVTLVQRWRSCRCGARPATCRLSSASGAPRHRRRRGIPHHGAGPACRQAPGPPLSVLASVSRPAISAR